MVLACTSRTPSPSSVSCPFVLAVTDRAVCPLDLVVALPFIRVTLGCLPRITVHVLPQSLAVCMPADSQAALPALSANSPNHGWPIIVIGGVPTSLVRATARRIKRIGVAVAFFPPRSETSRRSPSRRLAAGSDSTFDKHSVGFSSAIYGLSGVIVRVPLKARSRVRPCRHHAVTTRLVAAQDDSRRRWCRCRGCRRPGTSGSDNLQGRALECETVAHAESWHYSQGIAVRVGGNTSAPTYHSLVHRANQLSGRSFPDFNMHKLFT